MKRLSKILTASGVVASLGACASMSPKLAAPELRTKTWTIQTSRSKDQSFDSIAKWAAETFNDSNKTTRLSDKATGTFVAKGNVSCSALKLGNGFAQNEHLDFTLTAETKDKKVSVTVSDIVGSTIPGAWDSGLRPATQKEAETAFHDCIEPVIDSIKSRLK